MLVAQAAALAALSGFAIAAFVAAITSRMSLAEFVGLNVAPTSLRRRALIGETASIASVVVATVAFAAWRLRGARAGRLLRFARLALPLSIPAMVVLVVNTKHWDALQRAAAISVVALATAAAIRTSGTEIAFGRLAAARWIGRRLAAVGRWAERPWVRRLAPVVVGAAAIGWAAYTAYFSLRNHGHFRTASNDLGQYDNFFYNALHGHPFRCTPLVREGDWSSLRSHAEFSMYALLPFYALAPRAETLLVLQAVVVASAAIPIYRFAARRLSRGVGVALALAYLFYAPLQSATFYDVHFQMFGAASAAWAIDALDARQRVAFVLFFVLALGCREDISVGFVILGAFLILTGRAPRAGTLIAGAAALYFGVLKFAVMPRFGTFYYADHYFKLFPEGEPTYGGVMKTLVSNPSFSFASVITPEKLTYAAQVLAPLAFLPIRRGLVWMSVLPGAMFTILTTEYMPTVAITFQYVAYNVPFLFAGAALALEAFRRGPQRGAHARYAGGVAALVVATFLSTRAWGAIPPADDFRAGFGAPDFTPSSP
jgi:uncharacterized membrane protein